VNNNYPWDFQKVVVVQRRLLFGGCSENVGIHELLLEKQVEVDEQRAKLSIKQLSFSPFFKLKKPLL
jgi:hypothetical protein